MRILFLITFLTLATSCKKNHHVIHVKATNIVTGTGAQYEGLKFSVVATTPGVFESNYKNVYEGYLDANGEASFDLKMKNNKSYSLGIQLPENTCYFNDLYFSLKHDLKNQIVEVEFAPCAYLKLKVNNVNCEGPSDNFKLFYMGRLVGGQGDSIVGALSQEGNGCYSYEGVSFSDVPMGEIYYRWEVTRTSGTEIFYDTIYLDAGEYKTFEINY